MSEETSHISETDEQLRAKKRKRRVRYAILYPAILIALSVLCYFLYRIDDFVHVCRIPPGTTVVDSGSIRPYDPVFDDFFRSGKHPKLQSYLMYRHYVIPDGVTEIGERAFVESMCLFLRSVEIPGSVKKIGRGAFEECCNLTTIELPEGVETIDPMAFRKCVNLKRVELPDSLKTIGAGAFAGCTALERIRIPDGVTAIGLGAFLGCSSLADVELPPGVNVAPEAFSGTLVPPEKIPPPKQPQP